eukprot:2186967-Rhodomonas_salina.2
MPSSPPPPLSLPPILSRRLSLSVPGVREWARGCAGCSQPKARALFCDEHREGSAWEGRLRARCGGGGQMMRACVVDSAQPGSCWCAADVDSEPLQPQPPLQLPQHPRRLSPQPLHPLLPGPPPTREQEECKQDECGMRRMSERELFLR